jgi:YbbR domain-containing protein
MVSSITTASACGLSGAIHYSPSHVTVYGPLAQLATIKQLYTETLTIKGIKDTLTTTIKLQKIDGVRIVPDQIAATVPVEPFTEKKIEVLVEGIGTPIGYTMRIFPIKVNLVCYVAISRYNDVKASDFRVGVDFFSMGKSSKIKYPVKLVKSPSFVSKIRIQPSEVEVLMEEANQ